MSTSGILGWLAAVFGLMVAADYGLIHHILAEAGVVALIAWAFRLSGKT